MPEKNSDLLEKIIEAKKIIGDKAIPKIVEHYHVDTYDPVGKKACCPFHREDTPSFIWNEDEQFFKCFGCGRVVSLLDVYTDECGSYVKGVEKLCKEAGVEFDAKSATIDRKERFKTYRFPKPLTTTNRDIIDAYCAKRGISKRTLDYAEVKQTNDGNIAFDLYDSDGTLLCRKLRKPKHVSHGENKMWWDKGKDGGDVCPALFNLNKVDITKPVICVEGYFDALAVIESGCTNVVSIPGSAEDDNWIEFNFELVEKIPEFILWYDNDKAGQNGLKKVVGRLGEYRCKIVTPEKEDEDAVEKFYNNLKENLGIRKTDANNILLACGPKQVVSLINGAKEVPSKKLKYLMDCEQQNIMEQEKFPFGIDELDKVLYGNLFSCFTIYSGKPGSGKSSIANITSLIAPVESGYKAFSFSGELADGQLADWVVTNLAGQNHIIEVPNARQGGCNYHVVTKEAESAIRKYYKEKMVLFSDEDALDVSGESLLKGMEEAYRRYGCRVFLIDNLMCLDFENTEDDKWASQKRFIIRLMNFAKSHNACVNLILHPKKMARDQKEVNTFDLHGASEIGNLCHRMIWVDRLKDDDSGFNTKITIVKDRPTGHQDRSLSLYYNEQTRRFYSSVEEYKKKYKWETDKNFGGKIKYDKEVQSKLVSTLLPMNHLPNEDNHNGPIEEREPF